MNEVVRPAVFGNVGTIILFRVGAKDAEELESEFTPRFVIEDLVNLKKFDIYLKLMIDGVSSDPFSATTLPPLREDEKTGNREKMIRVTHERYSKPRAVIEEKIARWTGMLEEKAGDEENEQDYREAVRGSGVRHEPALRVVPPKEQRSAPSRPAPIAPTAPLPYARSAAPAKSKKEYPIICDMCKKPSTVFFNPDPKKPIYCKDCLKKVKSSVKEQPKPAPQPKQAPQKEMPVRQAVQEKKSPGDPVIILPPENTPELSLQDLVLKEIPPHEVKKPSHPKMPHTGSAVKPGEKIVV